MEARFRKTGLHAIRVPVLKTDAKSRKRRDEFSDLKRNKGKKKTNLLTEASRRAGNLARGVSAGVKLCSEVHSRKRRGQKTRMRRKFISLEARDSTRGDRRSKKKKCRHGRAAVDPFGGLYFSEWGRAQLDRMESIARIKRRNAGTQANRHAQKTSSTGLGHIIKKY